MVTQTVDPSTVTPQGKLVPVVGLYSWVVLGLLLHFTLYERPD